ncbi:MAG: TonB-dependent receptor [Betaproteobacteria bacterium]
MNRTACWLGPWQAGATLLGLALAAGTQAQMPTAEPSSAKDEPVVVERKASATLAPVVVRGNAENETEERRRSTASKIIFGRDEIERFGDSTVGEILKRLPGVTTQGRPGRGGAPRMRGLGGGYTQILIDGEPVPRGFSLDDLSPEQIERIEILRAPTAETGARAIAGTINIITRGGYSKRVNELRLGLGLENGHDQPSVSWTRNETLGSFNYNVSLSANHSDRASDSVAHSRTENLATGALIEQTEEKQASDSRNALHANARLQWRDERGNTLVLMPMFVVSEGSGGRGSELQQSGGVAPYTHSTGSSDGRFSTARLGGQWTYRLEQGGNANLRFGLGQSEWISHTDRTNFDVTPGVNSQQNTSSEQHDTTFSSSAKFTKTLDNAHSLVTGMELDANRRVEAAHTLQDGETPLSDFDGNLKAGTTRAALYAQDEWALTPQWAVHAGLRWEGIDTRGSLDAAASDVRNRSSVLTPLLHAVWKFAPESRDQMRFSLTRSYRAPDLQNLIARPSINSMFAGRGTNEQIHPDRAGNPGLLPELATGLDVALERYIAGSGIITANVFFRNIHNLMRRETALETVSWADVPRWVSRMQNIGDASTRGIELEAKLRLSDLLDDAPKLDLRANASVFSSKVQGVPGPNNRLDQQPDGTLNFGADYRIPNWPLTLGGNVNWTPGYSTRLSADQLALISSKRVADAFVLWTLSPAWQLRVSASNLAPRWYTTSGALDSVNSIGQPIRTATDSLQPTDTRWQIGLEIKI